MRTKISKSIWQVISIGILAGMRTTAAPVIASHILSSHPSKELNDSPLKFMQSETAAWIFKAAAAGEIIGDKLPAAPNRIEPGGIIGRCLAGGLAGASMFKASNHNAFTGALLGSISAFAGTFGSFYLRRGIAKNTDIPDTLLGAMEDTIVIASGIVLIKTA